MKIFISVGEPSGDIHGANLVTRLRTLCPEIECLGFGGPRMAEAGCRLVADLTQLAVMFLWSVIKNYGRFRSYLREAEVIFRRDQVDAVVLIDYPGFNWQIARRAKKYGIPVFYYGVPQMWAWAPWRVRKLKRLVDHVLCKLPFEEAWFAQRGVRAQFVGHPFFDDLGCRKCDEDFCQRMRTEHKRHLLLLPGSRDAEVERHWPTLRDAALMIASQQPVQISVGAFKESHRRQIVADVAARGLAIGVYQGKTDELMRTADGCLACSGSVSLELMYHLVPTIIIYRVSKLAFVLQKFFIRCRYITLVNLLATDRIERGGRGAYDPDMPGAELVPMPEYLTATDCSAAAAARMSVWFADEGARQANRDWLRRIREQVASAGATDRAACYILACLGAQTENQVAVARAASRLHEQSAA